MPPTARWLQLSLTMRSGVVFPHWQLADHPPRHCGYGESGGTSRRFACRKTFKNMDLVSRPVCVFWRLG